MTNLEKVISLKEMDSFARHVLQDLEQKVLEINNNNNNTAQLLLYGDLGAGKTTFVQHVGTLLEVEEVISSPTFVLMKLYETTHSVFKRLVHIDAYRLKEEEISTFEMLLGEIDQPNTLACIEWPEEYVKKTNHHCAAVREIYFNVETDDSRAVIYKKHE